MLHLDTGLTWRGGQQQAYLLHRELVGRGIGSRLAAPEGSALLDRCRAEGLPVLALPGRSPWSPRVLAAVGRGLRGAAILHAHDAHAATLGALLRALGPGLRLVCHRRVSYSPASNPWSRWKYGRADAWVAVSREIAEALVRFGVAPGRARAVHSALDLEAFRAAAARADLAALRHELQVPEGAPVIGFCAAFSPQKGHGVLVEAAPRVLARFPQAVFLLAGEGGLRPAVEEAVRERGLAGAFRFAGHRPDVAALTALFTVGCVPSVDGEGSSASLKEPMALGLPVVASDLRGNLEVLGDAGLVFPNRDATALASVLGRLLGDEGLRSQVGTLARERSGRFSVAAMAEGVLAVYGEVLR